MTLTLKIANRSFSKALWLMMLHHSIMFGNQMFGGLEGIIWTNIDILTFIVTLTLNTVIHLFHKALWLTMIYHQTMFGCRRINSSENTTERVIFFIISALTVTLTLKIANNFFFFLLFCMPLWPTMLHRHTKFGKKMFCGSEDIIQTNIH